MTIEDVVERAIAKAKKQANQSAEMARNRVFAVCHSEPAAREAEDAVFEFVFEEVIGEALASEMVDFHEIRIKDRVRDPWDIPGISAISRQSNMVNVKTR